MYCSSCGVAVTPGVSYCNYCGAKLDRDKASEVRPDWLVFMMTATFIFGLVAITMMMGVMKVILRLEGGFILGVAFLSFLTMLFLEGVFIRLLLSRKEASKESKAALSAKNHATNELDATQQRVLTEAQPSVTEHTTRAFEPTYEPRRK
jgi:hypothetical protein